MDLQENIAGVHFDHSGIHGGTPAGEIPLVKSREEYAASLKCCARSGKDSVYMCVFNVICMAAYQLLIETASILRTG